MALVPRSSTTLRELRRELDRPRYFPSYYDYNWNPYLWEDSRHWWPYDLLHPMDELVTRRVRNQLIRSTPVDWVWPMLWRDSYPGERVQIDEKGFKVDIDVRQFKSHEIKVKTNDDYIVVEGNHDRRNDGNGLVERHFYRKYLLPRGFNANEVVSDLSTDGILTIKAPPPLPMRHFSGGERSIQIQATGKPALTWRY